MIFISCLIVYKKPFVLPPPGGKIVSGYKFSVIKSGFALVSITSIVLHSFLVSFQNRTSLTSKNIFDYITIPPFRRLIGKILPSQARVVPLNS